MVVTAIMELPARMDDRITTKFPPVARLAVSGIEDGVVDESETHGGAKEEMGGSEDSVVEERGMPLGDSSTIESVENEAVTTAGVDDVDAKDVEDVAAKLEVGSSVTVIVIAFVGMLWHTLVPKIQNNVTASVGMLWHTLVLKIQNKV